MKLINDNDFEFIFRSPPPQSGQPTTHGLNLPPENAHALPDANIGQSKGKPKPLNLDDPKDLEYAISQVIQQDKSRHNAAEITRKAADAELGGTSSGDITEQHIKMLRKKVKNQIHRKEKPQ